MKLNLKNDYEAQVRESVDSAFHSLQEIESFGMFHNDMELVKKSPNSPIHDPLEETNSFKESVDFYMDKSVTECEAELLICHKETSYNIIKDTWVDEGYPTKDKIFIRTKVDEKIYKIYSWNCENKETVKDNIGINVLNPLAKEEPDQSKDLMQEDEDATRKLDDNVYKEIVVPEDKILLQKLDIKRSKTLGFEGDEIKQNHAKVFQHFFFHISKTIPTFFPCAIYILLSELPMSSVILHIL